MMLTMQSLAMSRMVNRFFSIATTASPLSLAWCLAFVPCDTNITPRMSQNHHKDGQKVTQISQHQHVRTHDRMAT
jgi:hypothetical protein